MPTTHAVYEAGLEKNQCRVRSLNEQGQEWPGQKPKFPFAHDTARTDGIVKRKPVFAHKEEFTYKLLEPVFKGFARNADYERLSDEAITLWARTLDRVDLDAVDFNDCDTFLNELFALCSRITKECTGKSLEEWGVTGRYREELLKAWRHFVRTIWVRDPNWEDLVRMLSDPNAEINEDADYYLPNLEQEIETEVERRLMLPLGVWSTIMRSCALAQAPMQNPALPDRARSNQKALYI